MEESIPKRIFQYEIIEKLGEGKNGQTFKAFDSGRDRTVVLKLLHPETATDADFRKNFAGILASISKLDHPGVGACYELIEHQGRTAIVSEFIEGNTAESLVRTAPLSGERFLEIATAVTKGLDCLHDHDILHGNIQPSNIMVESTGGVKLIDAGLPRRPGWKPGEPGLFSMDTIGYASPGELEDRPPERARDLFSLGAVFYYLLSGRPPFVGNDPRLVANAILHDRANLQLLRAHRVPGDIIRMIDRLLCRRRKERCLETRELLLTLDAITVFERELAETPRPPARLLSPRQYLAMSILVALLFILWTIVSSTR